MNTDELRYVLSRGFAPLPNPSPTGRGATKLLPRPLGEGLREREGKTNVFFL